MSRCRKKTMKREKLVLRDVSSKNAHNLFLAFWAFRGSNTTFINYNMLFVDRRWIRMQKLTSLKGVDFVATA
jgi:hypothetical protein